MTDEIKSEDNKNYEHVFQILKKVSADYDNASEETSNSTTKLIKRYLAKLSDEQRKEFFRAFDSQDRYTPLMWAAKNGSCSLMNLFLDLDGSILDETGGWNGSTALMKAAECGQQKAVLTLIGFQANLNMKNKFGSTALMLAAERGVVEVVKLLLNGKANLDLQNKYEYTALILAAEEGNSEVVRILCKARADRNIKNKFGKTALIMAAEFGQIDCVKALIEETPDNEDNKKYINIDEKSNKQKTALMLAAVNGHVDVVKYLIEQGADTTLQCNAKGEEDGKFALNFSFISGKPEIVKMLMLNSRPDNRANSKGCTLFMQAAECGYLDIVKLLVEHENKDNDNANMFSYIAKSCRDKSKDGNTALHLAAAQGHIEVLVYLMDYAHEAMTEENEKGQNPKQLLVEYYVNREEEFEKFIRGVINNCELLELLSYLLPKFKSPNAVLNTWFATILLKIKEADKLDMVSHLVHLCTGIKLAMEAHPLEAPDLEERLDFVQEMLKDCMGANSMDTEQNVLLFVEDRVLRNRNDLSEASHRAWAFIEGPLRLCIKHQFLGLFGTRQVRLFVNKVFNTSLRVKTPRPLLTIKDIFQMRSNCVNWRTNPSFNFYFEGLCKLVTLVVVATLCWQQSPFTLQQLNPNYDDDTFKWLSIVAIIIAFTSALGEVGELMSNECRIQNYFLNDNWNYLDVSTLLLYLSWAVMSLQENFESYAFVPGSHHVTAATATNFSIPHPTSKALLCLTALLLSLYLLKYASVSDGIGHYVLMVFAMAKTLRHFVVVLLLCTAGFAIALHGLFPYMDNFRTVQQTMLELFFSLNGQFDSRPSIFEGDPNESVGILLFVSYIALSGLVLMNIITATFAAIYNNIDEKAKANWCYIKALTVQRLLLLQERNPLFMLPAPFNLVPVVLSVFHYPYIQLTYSYRKHQLSDKDMTEKEVTKESAPIATNPISGLNSKSYESKPSPFLRHRSSASISPDAKGRSSHEGNCIKSHTHNANNGSPRSCSFSCRECKGAEPILSISGTASDVTVGLIVLFPGALYEVYLCLIEIRKYQKSRYLFWICLAITVIGFPFFYLGFVVTLFIEILQQRTMIIVEEKYDYRSLCELLHVNSGETVFISDAIIKYLFRYKFQVSYDGQHLTKRITPDVGADPSKYIILSIKIISVEFEDSRVLSRNPKCPLGSRLSHGLHLYVVMKIGNQVLVTRTMNWNDKNEKKYLSEVKVFRLPFNAKAEDRVVHVEVYDNHTTCLGKCVQSLDDLIANGRFEEDLELELGVGKVQVDAKRTYFSQEMEVKDRCPIKGKENVCRLEEKKMYSVYFILSRCTTTKKESFTSQDKYVIELTIGDQIVKTPDLTCDGSVIKCDHLLCLPMPLPASQTLYTPLEIVLKQKSKSSEGTYDELTRRPTTMAYLIAEDCFHGKLGMPNDDDPIYTIELEATMTTDMMKDMVRLALPSDSTPEKSQRLEALGKRSCGREIRYDRPPIGERKEKLFSEADIDRIFLGIEPDQSTVTKSKISYELRQEINRMQEKNRMQFNTRFDQLQDRLDKVIGWVTAPPSPPSPPPPPPRGGKGSDSDSYQC